jgi:hypothetical protein
MKMNRLTVLVGIAMAGLLGAATSAFAGEDWRPIDPAVLAMKTPVVEKDADAEVIFWEIYVDDAGDDLVFNNYIRIKVFTERGKESQSTIELPYFGRYRLVDIAGRTIKPDGSIVELKKDAIFDRTVVKAGGFKVKVKSFAMPAVEPGAVIEYRWREVRPGALANYIRLYFQRDIPVQFVRYHLKPLSGDIGYSSLGMSTRMFNGKPAPLTKDKDGFYTTSLSNLPAFREEPRMPPEDEVKTWMLVFYSRDKPAPPETFWPKLGKEIYEQNKSSMKVNDDVKKTAATVIGDASDPEQKLHRLFDFCVEKIKNVNDDASGITATDRAKLKANESPADTLKRSMGTPADIRRLFAALATAAGFDARLALTGDRSDMFFNVNFTDGYFLDRACIAVKVGNDWRFFDPGSMYVPFGMLPWQEEGMQAIITDPKQGTFVQTPISSAEKSLEKRVATLKLTEDGAIEGDIRVEYTGHLANEKKEENDDDSPAQRETNLIDAVKKRLSTAELTDIKIENVTDPEKPFIYSFHVRVPGYAQRTGKRLFLQPAFFQRGLPALFGTSERKSSIYFHYPWSEEDQISISLPRGFELDNADRPNPFHIANIAEYDVSIGVVGKSESLVFRRKFKFNGLVFPATSYSGLKQLFDVLHTNDEHAITLKQAITASNQD